MTLAEFLQSLELKRQAIANTRQALCDSDTHSRHRQLLATVLDELIKSTRQILEQAHNTEI